MKLLSRREFFKVGLSSSGSLLYFMLVPVPLRRAFAQAGVRLNRTYIEITPDNEFFFVVDKSEMGQGVITGQTTLFGEQADIAPDQFQIRTAPVADIYGTMFGQQITGGSTSTADRWLVLQKEGAKLRTLMQQAAAQYWKVSDSDIQTDRGIAKNVKSGEQRTYGQLIQVAAQLPDPGAPKLKPKSEFKYIGKFNRTLDAKEKSTGTTEFGLDFSMDGMLTALVLRAPRLGQKLKTWDVSEAKLLPGFKDAFPISSGLAIVCEKFWQTAAARNAIKAEWSADDAISTSSESVIEKYRELLKKTPGRDFSGADKTVTAEYILPYLAHATMEPMNATAFVRNDSCEIWSPNQAPTLIRNEAARVLGLKREQVKVHTTKFLGGGFGRRSTTDYSIDAVEISKKMNVPVKVVWTREDDMRFSPLRPLTVHQIRGAVKAGRAVGWEHQFGCESIMQYLMPSWFGLMLPEWLSESTRKAAANGFTEMLRSFGLSPTEPEGAHIKYEIPKKLVKHHTLGLQVPIHFWRSVGHSYNGFVVESFMDEMAHAAGVDPLQFRRDHLKHPRLKGVLERVAKMANWNSPLEKGRGRGLACHFSFESYVAEVAEVEIVDQKIRVKKVYCAVDCGMVVNPDMVKKQMESGIIYGLSAALLGEIHLENGSIVEVNFDTYKVARYGDAPEIIVEILESEEKPTGVGEPGLPPIAPAIANAVFQLTGRRIRRLPLSLA